MLDGPSVVAALKECRVTHVVWVPDSEIGTWEGAILAEPSLTLVRVCREGEAIAVAAGLHLGGKRPLVVMQCTGFFEAGDAFRNVVHDLKLPLLFLVGVRGYEAHQRGATNDTCPVFAQPLVGAWNVPHVLRRRDDDPACLVSAYRQTQTGNTAVVLLLGE
ncbi:MAG TPA: thiamine pyrophosphate-binding protein [Gemmataceae bacterium]|nr:thiamine pyrophosphate-binding protein [Gemmataceae bacterium]